MNNKMISDKRHNKAAKFTTFVVLSARTNFQHAPCNGVSFTSMNNDAPHKYFTACSTGKFDVVLDYLKQGISPESLDKNKLTGLIWTGRKGRIEVADLLLKHGANINTGDIRNRTALFHSVTYYHFDFVEFMASQDADLNIIDTHKWTALDAVINKPSKKINK